MISYLISSGLRAISLCSFTVVGASADESVSNKQLEAILSERRILRGLIGDPWVAQHRIQTSTANPPTFITLIPCLP